MNRKGFTLIELLIVVAIIGILAAVGAAVIPNILTNTKINAAKTNHANVVNWFQLKAVECETEGKITYSSWSKKGTTQEKTCNYTSGWNLVMDLGYNHIRYHFLAEEQYNKNYMNPFDGSEGVQWSNFNPGSCGKAGQTSFYGYGSGSSDFQVWTNIDGECLYDRVTFPLN